MRVTDLIRRPAVTATPDMTLSAAAKLMESAGVGALIVLDAERLTGIVTDRDLVVRGLAAGLPADARVDNVMTMDPVTIDANADLAEASRALSERKFRRLPVTSAGSVVGLIAADDLMLAYLTELSDAVWPILGEVFNPQHEAPFPVPTQQG